MDAVDQASRLQGRARRLQLSLLGEFSVRTSDGNPIAISGKKNRALLAILTLAPHKTVSRARLCTLLWGEHGNELARNNLRQSLSVLKRELGTEHSAVLSSQDDRLTLDTALVSVDAVDVIEAAETSDLPRLRTAAVAVGGSLLSDFGGLGEAFEEWLALERQHIQAASIRVLERLIEAETGEAKIATARRLVQLDPLRESSHRLLMRAHAEQGDNGSALRQFGECRKLLRDQLGVDPAPETRQLRDQIAEPVATPQVTAQTQPAALTVDPTRCRIAVLPFTNLSGDPEQEYLAEGLAEDVLDELSRFRGLFVIARNSSFSFKDKGLGIEDIARALNVEYIVSGSVRRTESRIRVAAQLNHVATGQQVWAEHYDRQPAEIFKVRDDVVRTIVITMEARLRMALIENTPSRDTPSLAVYECVQLATKYLHLHDASRAMPYAERALQLDPDYAFAHITMSRVHYIRYLEDPLPEMAEKMYLAARKAVSLDRADSGGQAILGLSLICKRQYELAGHHLERAVSLNPADTFAMAYQAECLLRTGHAAKALAVMDELLQRDPYPHPGMWDIRGMALLMLGRYAEALVALPQVPVLFWFIHGALAICHARLGQLDAAKAEIDNLLAQKPGMTIRQYILGEEFQRREDLDFLAEGLRLAGLPE